MSVPSKPATFTPEGLPPNTVSMLVPFWQNRAIQTPRLTLVHTNGASGIATNQSSYNWATAKPESNTLPHYQVQLDGRAAKYIPTNRRGLDNATVTAGSAAWSLLTQAQRNDINAHGQVRNWSIGIETSDLGYGAGKMGDLSGFTEPQIETLAGILAYDSILWNIPLAYPDTWWGTGTACHTEPFEYPYWTLYRGKTCPGSLKKILMRTRVLPRANEIRAAWMGGPVIPTPPDPDEEEVFMHEYWGYEPQDLICAVYPNLGYKVAIADPGTLAKHKAQTLGHNPGADVVDHVTANVDDWRAFGPLLSPVAGYDEYGIRAS